MQTIEPRGVRAVGASARGELLRLRGVGAPHPRECSVIGRQARHLPGLVEDLLDVSRIMHGKIDLRRTTVDLAAAVSRGIEAAQPVLDAHGLKDHRFNACGYSLGTVYAPCWMDWPMFFHGNPVEIAPGMVLFVHIILMDSDAGLAMTLARTSLITERGPQPLSARPLDLIVR